MLVMSVVVDTVLMAESVHHLSTLVNWGISASSAQHLEQYKKVVGRWRHSQQAIQPSTWSGTSLYLAPSLTQLVQDLTWAGVTDRLHYHSLLMFVFGANHYQACIDLDMDVRHW